MDHKSKLVKQLFCQIAETNLKEYELNEKLLEILSNYHIIELDKTKMDLADNINTFLKGRKRVGLKQNTLKTYKYQLSIFQEFINKPVHEIQKNDIEDFLTHREDNFNISSKLSLETTRRVLKSFFGWLEKEHIIYKNPMNQVEPYKLPNLIADSLTIDELEIIRDACLKNREKALVEILYSSGCRLREITEINISDIDWNNKTIKIKGKGEKERNVLISQRAIIMIRKYLEQRIDNNDALFVTERKPYSRLGARSIEREINKISKCTNISKKITPHTFRHTFATIMLNNGCPPPIIQELLGHEHYNATSLYAKVSNKSKKDAYEKYLY